MELATGSRVPSAVERLGGMCVAAEAGLQQWPQVTWTQRTQHRMSIGVNSLPKPPTLYGTDRVKGLARPKGRSPAGRAQGSRVWQRKASMPNPPRGLESTPGGAMQSYAMESAATVLASKQS